MVSLFGVSNSPFDSSTRNWMRNLPKIWGGDSIKIVWRGHVKKIIPKYMILKLLVITGLIWGPSGVILERRIADSQFVTKRFVKFVNV